MKDEFGSPGWQHEAKGSYKYRNISAFKTYLFVEVNFFILFGELSHSLPPTWMYKFLTIIVSFVLHAYIIY